MVKKIITKVSKKEEPKVTAVAVTEETEEAKFTPKPKKRCIFCQTKTPPSYTDIVSLRKFLTDRGRIVPKLRSGLCSKHQRRVTKQIKYARHLALLPFTLKV